MGAVNLETTWFDKATQFVTFSIIFQAFVSMALQMFQVLFRRFRGVSQDRLVLLVLTRSKNAQNKPAETADMRL